MSSVPSPNRVLLSAAGSGKTTLLVRQALERPERRIAIVTLHSWYGFLLRQCIRPYQAALCPEPRIETILFVEGVTNNRAPRTQVARHYLAGNRMYSDRAADFAVRCDELTQGQVMARLAAMYDELYIDEVQDLAGFDLDLVERLLKSDIAITLVGDTRQATYATNYAQRHSQYRGPNLAALFQIWESDGLCQLDHRLISLRCVQALCDMADTLYRQMPRTESGNGEVTGHDGIFLVAPGDVAAYMQEFALPCSGMTGGKPATECLR